MKDDDKRATQVTGENVTKKTLAYEKPRVIFRQRLEAVAAACDPGAGGKDVVPDTCTIFAGS
jgi:hypothetical protein